MPLYKSPFSISNKVYSYNIVSALVSPPKASPSKVSTDPYYEKVMALSQKTPYAPTSTITIGVWSSQPKDSMKLMGENILNMTGPLCKKLGFHYICFCYMHITLEDIEAEINYPAIYIEMTYNGHELMFPKGGEFTPRLTVEQEVARRMGIEPMADHVFKQKDVLQVVNDQLKWFRRTQLKGEEKETAHGQDRLKLKSTNMSKQTKGR